MNCNPNEQETTSELYEMAKMVGTFGAIIAIGMGSGGSITPEEGDVRRLSKIFECSADFATTSADQALDASTCVFKATRDFIVKGSEMLYYGAAEWFVTDIILKNTINMLHKKYSSAGAKAAEKVIQKKMAEGVSRKVAEKMTREAAEEAAEKATKAAAKKLLMTQGAKALLRGFNVFSTVTMVADLGTALISGDAYVLDRSTLNERYKMIDEVVGKMYDDEYFARCGNQYKNTYVDGVVARLAEMDEVVDLVVDPTRFEAVAADPAFKERLLKCFFPDPDKHFDDMISRSIARVTIANELPPHENPHDMALMAHCFPRAILDSGDTFYGEPFDKCPAEYTKFYKEYVEAHKDTYARTFDAVQSKRAEIVRDGFNLGGQATNYMAEVWGAESEDLFANSLRVSSYVYTFTDGIMMLSFYNTDKNPVDVAQEIKNYLRENYTDIIDKVAASIADPEKPNEKMQCAIDLLKADLTREGFGLVRGSTGSRLRTTAVVVGGLALAVVLIIFILARAHRAR